METTDFLMLLFSLGIGFVLGVIFFGGLWWTLQLGLSSRYAGLWLLVSLLLRGGICLVGFYLVGRDHPERFLVCLVGFIVARIIILKLTAPKIIFKAFDTEPSNDAD